MKTEMICYCSGVTKEEIITAIEKGAKTIDDIRTATGACTLNKCKEMSPTKKCCSGAILKILKDYGNSTKKG